MLILFNHGTPKGLARALPGHTIIEAQARGWHSKISPDEKSPSLVLTGTTKWSRVRLHLERIAAVVNAAAPGSYTEVEIA